MPFAAQKAFRPVKGLFIFSHLNSIFFYSSFAILDFLFKKFARKII
jgi:hypothetical protein